MGRRQRKLRSISKSQSKSQKKRIRSNVFKKTVLWVVFSGAALLVLALIVGYFVISSYLSGDSFRKMLEGKIATQIHANKVELAPLNWGGSSLGTDKFDAQGDQILRNLKINKFDAVIDRGAIFDQHLKIKDVTIDSVVVDLVQERKLEEEQAGVPTPGVTPAPTAATAPEPTAPAAEPRHKKEQGWFARNFVPNKYSLGEASIRSFSLSYKQKKEVKDELYSISNVRARMTPESGNNEYKLLLEEGTINVPFNMVSVGKLQSALVRIRPERVSVTECRINPNYGGQIEAEAEWEKLNSSWWANIVVRDVQCINLISADWKKKVGGIIEGTARLSGEQGKLAQVSGSARITKGELTALPVLDTMAAFTKTAKFRRLMFNVAEANYTYSNKIWRISDIVLACDGLLRIEGWVEIHDDETINGRLQVGVVPGVMTHVPGAEEKVFLPGKMGLLWTNVNIHGTLDNTKEDLTARLIAAAGERLFDIVPETGQKVLLFTTDIASRILNGTNGNTDKDDNNDTKGDAPDKKKDKVDTIINTIDKATELIPLFR